MAKAHLLLSTGYAWGSVPGDEERVPVHSECTFRRETDHRQGDE